LETRRDVHAARIATLLFRLLETAEVQACTPHGFPTRQPRLDMFFDLALEVSAQFFVQFCFHRLAPRQSLQTIQKVAEHGAPLRRFQHLPDCGDQFPPGALFRFELFAPASRELIVFGAAVVLGRSPLCLNPAAPLQAVQSGDVLGIGDL
jgi:hypothetical protein